MRTASKLHQATTSPSGPQSNILRLGSAKASEAKINTTSTALPRIFFKHRGAEYRLFKRTDSRDAPWQFYFERNKKRYPHSLKTNDQALAIAKAKLILDAADKGELDQMRAVVTRRQANVQYATIGELIQHFERMPLEVTEQTRRTYVNCFKLVLRKVHGEKVEPEQLSCSVLNEETTRRWFEIALEQSQQEKDQEEAARVKRSANSIFNQAQCLLRPKVMGHYRRVGLVLPAVDAFLTTYDEEKFGSVAAVYDPPAEKIIRATLRDWLKLEDRNMFLAVGLELACGLRKQEVAQCCWGMWGKSMGAALLDGRGWVKNQGGRFVVPPIDPYWKLLNRRIEAEGWRGKPADLVLSGTATDLADNIFRNVGQWLRGQGWTTQKTNHALRAYSGSLMAMKFGIYRASAWLRHASVKTTEIYYTHFLNERVFRPELIRIRWAK